MKKKADESSDHIAGALGGGLFGGAAGVGVGALMGAARNGLFGRPELFYDDLARGALRGGLVGGGAGLGMGIGGGADGDSMDGARMGGKLGAGAGLLLGNLFVKRHEDDDEYLANMRSGKKKKPNRGRGAAEKQSKVYEAAEGVENMPIKQTKMNHKKCTPGEFGAMVKEAVIGPSALAPLAGVVVGGGVGALTSKKHRLRNAIIGALTGGAAGGAAEYVAPGLGLGAKYQLQDLISGKPSLARTGERALEAGRYGLSRKSVLPGLLATYGDPGMESLGDAAEEMATKTVAAGKDLAKKTLGTGKEVATKTLGAAKDKLTDVASRGTGIGMADTALKTVADNIPTSTGDAVNKGLDITTKGLGALNSWLDGGRTKANSARDFGAMVKEAVNPKTIMNLGRQAVGGVSGALTQGAPQAARRAMLDQRDAIGFVRDFGGAIGRPTPRSYVRDSLQQAGRDAFRGQVQGNAIAAAGAAGAGVGAGYGANYLNAYRDEANQLQQNAQPAVPSLPPAATQGIGSMIKANSARDFGAYVKQSFVQQYLPAAGMGAGLGAGVGAISGLINPGEEDEYDDEGRVIGRKQRSRFGAMLRNALMGAGVGGLVGGAAQHFAGPQTEKALNYMRGLFAPQQNEIASDEVLQNNLRDSHTTPEQFGPVDQTILKQEGVQPDLPVDLSAGFDENPNYLQYFKDNPFATYGTLNAPARQATPLGMRNRPIKPIEQIRPPYQ